MAVYRTYECPVCTKTFDFLHHPNDEPPPSFCPLCGANVSGKKKPRQTSRARSPAIKPTTRNVTRGIASRSVDGVYRQMESASQSRMQDAAELLGISTDKLSSMKMTDMKDGLREGDFSGQSSTPTDATKIVGQAPTFTGATGLQSQVFQSRTAGAEYAKTVRTGVEPLAGNRMREMITSRHSSVSSQVARSGQLNKKS